MKHNRARRGDVYLVQNRYSTGCEICKDRLGVVVSVDALNQYNGIVTVVYLTSSKQREAPYRVVLQSTCDVQHKTSTALCDQIYAVDTSRLVKRIGRVTEREMMEIGRGIMVAHGLRCTS